MTTLEVLCLLMLCSWCIGVIITFVNAFVMRKKNIVWVETIIELLVKVEDLNENLDHINNILKKEGENVKVQRRIREDE